MKIFQDIKNSIYGPAYYNELLAKPVSYSLKYFLKFILLASLAAAIVSTFIFIPNIKSFLDNAELKLIGNYPKNLTVAIKNGEAFATVPQPYFIKMPQSIKAENSNLQQENFIVLDTENKFDLEKFASYKTWMVLNKDTLSYIDSKNNQGITVQPLKNAPDMVVNKDIVVSLVGKIKPFTKFIYPILIISVFLMSLFVLAWHLVYMFFGALLVWLVARVKKNEISYMKSYQIGIHLMTPVIILMAVFLFVNFNFPFLFSLLLILFVVLNIKNNYEKKLI